jgi:hypothetical protein
MIFDTVHCLHSFYVFRSSEKVWTSYKHTYGQTKKYPFYQKQHMCQIVMTTAVSARSYPDTRVLYEMAWSAPGIDPGREVLG